MNDYYSIEKLSEKIYKKETKDYFKEIILSYQIGNYRSAVVMLFSVVICDLIYKLQDLKNLYNDETAKKIIDEIESIRGKSPKNSDWEIKLIELINEKTTFFEISVYENIIGLQKIRHLSAHPVLNEIDILYTPNKETVRAYIINILNGVLIKPPLLSKKIIDSLLIDLDENKEIFIEPDSLKKYLEAKYLNKLNENVENQIFKSLWRLVFKIQDEKCNNNRKINFEALKVIYNRNKNNRRQFIESDKNYFSSISAGIPAIMIINFLFINNEVYDLLTDEANEIIKGEGLKSNVQLLKSWFTSTSFKDHLIKIINIIKEEKMFKLPSPTEKTFENFYSAAILHDCVNIFYDLCIEIYSVSGKDDCTKGFDVADKRYNFLIKPYLEYFSKEQFKTLLNAHENNSQIYGRNRAGKDCYEVKQVIDTKYGEDFDYSPHITFIKDATEYEKMRQII